jgi:O-antigen/teichoic acid export membrane protein
VVLQCTALGALGLVFLGVSRVTADLLQALQRLPALAGTNLIAGLVINVASLVLMWLEAGPVGLALAYVLGALTMAVLPLWVVRSHVSIRPAFRLECFKGLLRQTRALGTQVTLGSLAESGEALLVPKLVGIAQYGFFSAGVLIPLRLVVVPDGLTTAYYPVISAAHQRGPGAAAREVSHFLIASLALSLPLVVLITFLAGPISEVLFPGRAEICRTVMQITIWYVALSGVGQVMGYGLIAAGKEGLEARLSLASTAAGLLLTVLLVWQFGLLGACYSFVGRHILGVLARAGAFCRTYATVPRRVPLGRITACGALMAGTMWLLALLGDPHLIDAAEAAAGGRWLGPLFVIALKAGLGVAAYGLALVALRVFGLDELRRLLQRKPSAIAPD